MLMVFFIISGNLTLFGIIFLLNGLFLMDTALDWLSIWSTRAGFAGSVAGMAGLVFSTGAWAAVDILHL